VLSIPVAETFKHFVKHVEVEADRGSSLPRSLSGVPPHAFAQRGRQPTSVWSSPVPHAARLELITLVCEHECVFVEAVAAGASSYTL
jgi:hypothetical protein